MKKSAFPSPDAHPLRQRAETKLRERQASAAASESEGDVRAVLHELQVHQIELEMQNEELQKARLAAQQAADEYTELFDFAPVGYFVLDSAGVILRINLAGAALLGADRAQVAGVDLDQYVAPDDRDAFRAFLQGTSPGEGRRTCELRLLPRGGGSRDLHLESIPGGAASRSPRVCLVAAIDITDRRRAEEKLRQLTADLERRVAERTASISNRNAELEHFNRAMVERELRMIELKQEVNALCGRFGESPRYEVEAKREKTT